MFTMIYGETLKTASNFQLFMDCFVPITAAKKIIHDIPGASHLEIVNLTLKSN